MAEPTEAEREAATKLLMRLDACGCGQCVQMIAQAIADAREAGLTAAVTAAEVEPELEGEMPTEVRIQVLADIDEAMRAVCRVTKRNILDRIRALKGQP